MPTTEDKLQTGTPETSPGIYLGFLSSIFFPNRDQERLKVTDCFLPRFSTHIDMFSQLQKGIISVCRRGLAGS